MRPLIDSIFNPVTQMLSSTKANLLRYAVERNKPIDLDSFFAPFALLGNDWVFALKAIMFSVFSVTVLFLAIAIRGIYLYFKEGVQWW